MYVYFFLYCTRARRVDEEGGNSFEMFIFDNTESVRLKYFACPDTIIIRDSLRAYKKRCPDEFFMDRRLFCYVRSRGNLIVETRLRRQSDRETQDGRLRERGVPV